MHLLYSAYLSLYYLTLICFETYIEDHNDWNRTGSVTTVTYFTVQSHNLYKGTKVFIHDGGGGGWNCWKKKAVEHNLF